MEKITYIVMEKKTLRKIRDRGKWLVNHIYGEGTKTCTKLWKYEVLNINLSPNAGSLDTQFDEGRFKEVGKLIREILNIWIHLCINYIEE